MAEEWVDRVRALAAMIGTSIRVPPHEQWLTDRLLEVTFEPTDPSAATIAIVAGPDEMTVFAGYRARFELGAPETAAEEALALARAVAGGGLSEKVGRIRVRYILDLGGGEEISGASSLGRTEHPVTRGLHRYSRYPGT